MVESGLLNLEEMSNFQLARILKCSPTRASTLVFNYRLRVTADDKQQLGAQLAKVTKIVPNQRNSRGGEVTLNVEDRFWRNELVDQLKRNGVYSDTSFNRERIVLDETSFFKACETVFGAQGKEIIKESKMTSGKRRLRLREYLTYIATGSLGKLGEIPVDIATGGVSISDLAEAMKFIML